MVRMKDCRCDCRRGMGRRKRKKKLKRKKINDEIECKFANEIGHYPAEGGTEASCVIVSKNE